MIQFTDRAIKLIAEAKIRAAMNDGKFDGLPGFGKPLANVDPDRDPNWWVRSKVKHEGIVNLFNPAPRPRGDQN